MCAEEEVIEVGGTLGTTCSLPSPHSQELKPLNTKKNANGPCQLDYLSSFYWDLCIDHLYLQHSENIEIYIQCPLGTSDPSALLPTKFFSLPALWSPINVFGPPTIEKGGMCLKLILLPPDHKQDVWISLMPPILEALELQPIRASINSRFLFARGFFLQYSKWTEVVQTILM